MTAADAPSGRWGHVRMTERAIDEPHRAASPLELLFDLTFVVAIAGIVAELAQGTAEGHAVEQVTPFLQVFFAIWWAWVNFTWFASSYDTDDVPYRLLTMLQMAGVLLLAAGVPAAFSQADYRAVTLGYLVMRTALVAQWLRAGIEHPASRSTAFRYAAGISALQAGWLLRLLLAGDGVLPVGSLLPVFVTLVAGELAVPKWAERSRPTSWHPGHIAERYGLFLIIVLGESVLAAFTGLQAAVTRGGLDWSLVTVAVAGLTLLFALWWLYFLQPSAIGLARNRERSFLWGYGHYGIFAAAAAVGAGLEVAVEGAGHHLDVSTADVGSAVAIPVAAFLVLLWGVHVPLVERPVITPALTLTAAVAVLLVPHLAGTWGLTVVVTLIAALCALLVAAITVTATGRRAVLPPE